MALCLKFCLRLRISVMFFVFRYTLSAKLGQYRIILSADTASEVRQMLSQKRR